MSAHAKRGQSIRLFLVDGSANGLIVASIPNWTGSVILAKNIRIAELFDREEAQRPGCYILQGEDLSHPMGVRAYVGQASTLSDRLRTQLKNKDWTDTVAIITTSDSNFTAGHFLALESKMIQLASDGKRAHLDNQISPNELAGGLGEADQADMENFLDQVKLILPVLDINIFRGAISEKIKQKANSFDDSEDILIIKHKSGVKAHAVIRDNEFIVLSGSSAISDERYQTNNYAPLRKSLIDQGVLKRTDKGEFLKFQEDTLFNSSSAAAAVILNRQSSGPKEWKHSTTGMPLGAWLDSRTTSNEISKEAAE